MMIFKINNDFKKRKYDKTPFPNSPKTKMQKIIKLTTPNYADCSVHYIFLINGVGKRNLDNFYGPNGKTF